MSSGQRMMERFAAAYTRTPQSEYSSARTMDQGPSQQRTSFNRNENNRSEADDYGSYLIAPQS